MHKVIIVPGLGDETMGLEIITKTWKRQDLNMVTCSMNWRDSREGLAVKLDRLLNLIDEFVRNGNKVSLVGTSAGGSAVLNAFMQRKDSIYRVINICGRLRTGTHKGIHSFETRTASSPAFAESVKMCEKELKNLTSEDKGRIITIRPLFGDELVPANTVTINDVRNITIPTIEHVLSIGLALTLFSRPIIKFLKN